MASLGRIVMGLAIALLCVVGFFALTAGLDAVTGWSSDAVNALGCTVLMVGFLGASFTWAKLARSAFREAHLEVLRPVPADGVAELMLVLDPKRPLTLVPEESTITFTCTQAGSDGPEVVAVHRQPLMLPDHLIHRVAHRVEVRLPVGVLASIVSESLQSTFVVTVGVQGWPDLVLRTTVKVLPPRGA